MPITIKSTGMKYKNPDTGVYQGVDMLEEATIRDVIVDVYSPTLPYAVGEYCLYNGELYCCTTAIPSGGETWNLAHWDKTNVTDELEDIKGAVIDLGSDDVANESNVTGATVSDALDNLSGAITQIDNDIAIVVNGKQSSYGATKGQFVLLRNSTISGKTDGIYKAAKAISANTNIDGTYLTAVSGGGLNALNNNYYADGTYSYTNANAAGYPMFFGFVTTGAKRLECVYTVEKTIPYGKSVTVTEVYCNARKADGTGYILATNTDFHNNITRVSPMGNLLAIRFDFDEALNVTTNTPFTGDGRLVFTIS